MVLGVGAGWLEPEFQALSVPYAERGPRTDEALRVIRNLWETKTSSFEGHWKSYVNMRMFPKAHPSRRGTIPIVVGGNGTASIRRAGELGDGWHPINLGPAELAEKLGDYRLQCERFGRQPGLVVHTAIVYVPLVRFMGQLSVVGFFRAIRPAMLIAFSTSS